MCIWSLTSKLRHWTLLKRTFYRFVNRDIIWLPSTFTRSCEVNEFEVYLQSMLTYSVEELVFGLSISFEIYFLCWSLLLFLFAEVNFKLAFASKFEYCTGGSKCFERICAFGGDSEFPFTTMAVNKVTWGI